MPTTLAFGSQSLNLGAHKRNAELAVEASSARVLHAISTSRPQAMATWSRLDKCLQAVICSPAGDTLHSGWGKSPG